MAIDLAQSPLQRLPGRGLPLGALSIGRVGDLPWPSPSPYSTAKHSPERYLSGAAARKRPRRNPKPCASSCCPVQGPSFPPYPARLDPTVARITPWRSSGHTQRQGQGQWAAHGAGVSTLVAARNAASAGGSHHRLCRWQCRGRAVPALTPAAPAAPSAMGGPSAAPCIEKGRGKGGARVRPAPCRRRGSRSGAVPRVLHTPARPTPTPPTAHSRRAARSGRTPPPRCASAGPPRCRQAQGATGGAGGWGGWHDGKGGSRAAACGSAHTHAATPPRPARTQPRLLRGTVPTHTGHAGEAPAPACPGARTASGG